MELIKCMARKGTHEEMRKILELGNVDVNYKDLCWRTPLHYCHIYGERNRTVKEGIAIIKLLIQYGADVNAIDVYNRHTPLMVCVSNRCHPALISTLLRSSADPNVEDRFGNVALFYYLYNLRYSRDIDTDLFRRLIPTLGVNRENCDNQTALMASVRRGCDEACIRALLRAGANTNVCKGLHPDHTIIHAYLEGYNRPTIQDANGLVVLELLINSGADVNHVDSQGFTPLMLFLNRGIRSIAHIKVLLNKGANVHVTDYIGNCLLHHRLMSSSTALCQLFLDCGANPNLQNKFVETPLTKATGYCLIKDTECISALRNYGANIYTDCLLYIKDTETNEVVPVSLYDIIHYYCVDSFSAQSDAKYEKVFKHVFLAHPTLLECVFYYKGCDIFKMKILASYLWHEFRKMKSYHFPSGKTLFDFVTETDPKKFIRFFQFSNRVSRSTICIEYPMLGKIIWSKIEIAIKWRDICVRLKFLSISSRPNTVCKKEVKLSKRCFLYLLQFLNDYDVQKLIDSTYLGY